MARITGRKLKAGFKKASTFGTAVQCAAGDGLTFTSLSDNDNPEVLENASLGLGLDMSNSKTRGKLSPTVNLVGHPTYQDAWAAIIATFFGVASTPSLATDLYLHRFTMDLDQKLFGTLAFEDTTTTVREWVSAYCNSLTIEFQSVPGYLQLTAGFICGEKELSTSVNTNANLASATQDSNQYIIVNNDDDFWLNAQGGGALQSSDAVDIMSYSLTLSKGLETVSEVTGSAGLTAPRFTEGFSGNLSVTLAGLDDHTWYTAAANGTEYKSSLLIEGTTPGTDTYSFGVYVPRMLLIQDPTNDISSQGENGVTLNFDLLEASSNPTGMNDATPYVEIYNAESSDYDA